MTEEQAVSKWETGIMIPDLEVLLKLSKLYGITINDILEPEIERQRITDFKTTRDRISSIRVETVEQMQSQTFSMINLSAIEKV